MARFHEEQFVLCVNGIDSIPEIAIPAGEIVRIAGATGSRVRIEERPDGGWYPQSLFVEHNPIFREGQMLRALTDFGPIKKGDVVECLNYDTDRDVEVDGYDGYLGARWFVAAEGPTEQVEAKARFAVNDVVVCAHSYASEGSAAYIRVGDRYTISGVGNEKDAELTLAERPDGGRFPAEWFVKDEVTEGDERSEDVVRAIERTIG